MSDALRQIMLDPFELALQLGYGIEARTDYAGLFNLVTRPKSLEKDGQLVLHVISFSRRSSQPKN